MPDDSGNIRRKPARGVFRISGQATIAFVTVCTRNREPWLANRTTCEALVELWRERALAWRVGLFVIMPDHLHILAAPSDDEVPVETWVRYWKRLFAQEHRRRSKPFQSNCWHMRIRDSRHFAEQYQYMKDNPVRRGLVSNAEDWPFTGVVHDIQWFGP